MFEKFTERSRKVMALAKDEARTLNHGHLGTEHVLLGLIAEDGGVASVILKHLGVDLTKARAHIERLRQQEAPVDGKRKPYETPGFRKLIEHSMEEVRDLGHNYIGTEHLLLGLVRDPGSVGSVALQGLGVNLHEVRNEVLLLLGHGT